MRLFFTRKELKLRRKRTIAGIVCLALVAGIYWILTRPHKVEPEVPTVIVEPAERDNVEIVGEYVGRIRAQQFVEVRARVEGYLESMLFAEGTYVNKNQVLFVINQDQYRAKADKARAQLKKDEAQALKAKRDLERIKPLYAQNAASQLDLDNAEAAYESAVFKTQIADNIRTAGTIENPTIPITHIIADTSEMRAYCKDDSTKIVGEATNAIKSFVTGGSENVISGVGALIGAGINMLMGSGEGVQAEHSDYFIMVDGLALVRIDVKSWIRKVTVVGITQKIESVLAFTAVKSSVDVDKISFNTFMEAYKYQLQRDAAHALNENDLMKEIKRAKEVYNLLKTDSAESTLVFDTLKLPGQNIHPAFIH